MEMRLYIFLFLVLALAACDRSETPQAPTAAETERLNHADAMLDNLAADEARPATAVADPANRSN